METTINTVAELFKSVQEDRENAVWIKSSPFALHLSKCILSSNYSEHSKEVTTEIYYTFPQSSENVTMAIASSPFKARFILLNYV